MHCQLGMLYIGKSFGYKCLSVNTSLIMTNIKVLFIFAGGIPHISNYPHFLFLKFAW